MTTVSMILQMFKTNAQQRNGLGEFRVAYGDIETMSERSIDLGKGHDVTIDADKFMVFMCSEELPVRLTHYTWDEVNEEWDAATPVDVTVQGIFSFPGKVSIYIENPSNNTSDLPYRFTVLYS